MEKKYLMDFDFLKKYWQFERVSDNCIFTSTLTTKAKK